MKEFSFASHGITCAAWHFPSRTNALASLAGRPCVVMAHGFGGTRDSGLSAFAEAFADVGIDVLVFDYRGFGDSDGTPRQDVSVNRQRQDYHAAIDAARHLPGVDRDRIALWGYSYAGGHVIAVAAQDPRVAAVVSMSPAMDGIATMAHLAHLGGIGPLLRVSAHGLRDVARARTGRSPHRVAVAGQPGSTAMITTPGALEGFLAMAGPTACNEVCARHALKIALNRPTKFASRLACPLLMQIGTGEQVVSVNAARRAAMKAGNLAQLREYPFDHFGGFVEEWQPQLLAEQIDFLTRVLDPSRSTDVHLRSQSERQRSGRFIPKVPW